MCLNEDCPRLHLKGTKRREQYGSTTPIEARNLPQSGPPQKLNAWGNNNSVARPDAESETSMPYSPPAKDFLCLEMEKIRSDMVNMVTGLRQQIMSELTAQPKAGSLIPVYTSSQPPPPQATTVARENNSPQLMQLQSEQGQPLTHQSTQLLQPQMQLQQTPSQMYQQIPTTYNNHYLVQPTTNTQ